MKSLTVVVTNYLRSTNVSRLVDALVGQTAKAAIFVWDNSPTQDFDDPRVDWLVHSSKNARCAARWWMASHAETDFVLVHDDDLMPADPSVLACTLDAASRTAPFAVGAAGVTLKRNGGYWESLHVGFRADAIRHDTRVDIVKGCYFCSPKIQLTRIGHLDLDAEDDIAVSAKLSGGVSRPHLVVAKLRTNLVPLDDGAAARKRRGSHRGAREIACHRLFGRIAVDRARRASVR